MFRRAARVPAFVIAVVIASSVAVVKAPVASAAFTEFDASPTGTGTACTPASPCSLATAQAQAHALVNTGCSPVPATGCPLSQDVVVYLHGGTYNLTAPLQFTDAVGTDLDFAFHKPASSSSLASGYNSMNLPFTPAFGNDMLSGQTTENPGQAATEWESSSTDTAPWWQVDLGAAVQVAQVQLDTSSDSTAAYHKNFAVQASNDPTFATYSTLASQGSTIVSGTWSATVTDTGTYRYARVAKTAADTSCTGCPTFRFAEFRLGPTDIHDSGNNGHQISYRNYPGDTPILSGGTQITGWSSYTDGTTCLTGTNCYRAPVSTAFNTRQIYINGVRAARTRGVDYPFTYSALTRTSTGYSCISGNCFSAISGWRNQSNIELVYTNGFEMDRCLVSSITGSALAVSQPCWLNASWTSQAGANNTPIGISGAYGATCPDQYCVPHYIENAYELLGPPGQFYIDRAGGYIYYVPRPGENLTDTTNTKVIAPTVDQLVVGQGTYQTPLQNLQISGIGLQYASWLGPSSTSGYTPYQAGLRISAPYQAFPGADEWEVTPAAVTFRAAKSVQVTYNNFAHLGGAALNMNYASQSDQVLGNTFTDISGAAVQLGDVLPVDHHPGGDIAVANRDGRLYTDYNYVNDNVISYSGVEYFDTPAIWAGFVRHSQIEHNDISFAPYDGISVGWSVGSYDPAQPGIPHYQATTWTTPSVPNTVSTGDVNNVISYNRIHDFMRILDDGGGIYTTGVQPLSYVTYNYIFSPGGPHMVSTTPSENGVWTSPGIYIDQGSMNMTIEYNVVGTAPSAQSPLWVNLHDPYSCPGNTPPLCMEDAVNNALYFNWSDNSTAGLGISGFNSIGSNTVYSPISAWPSGALSTIDGSGLEPFYTGIVPQSTQPNEALNKTTSSSTNYSSGFLSQNANDGYNTTGWSPTAADAWPWWQVDLGAAYNLTQVQLVTRPEIDDAVPRRNFEVRASNDPTFASYTVLASQGSTSLPFGSTFTANTDPTNQYRYIRVAKTVSEYFYIADFRAFAATANIAPGAPSSASLTDSGSAASYANDNSTATSWNATTGLTSAPWWQVDLGAAYQLSEVQLVMSSLADANTRTNFTVYGSTSDSTFGAGNYTVLGTVTASPVAAGASVNIYLNDAHTYRYVRVQKQTTSPQQGLSLAEVRVYP